MPGASPANSSTLRPVNGGGDGILVVLRMLGNPIESIQKLYHGGLGYKCGGG